jgi:hypothetical protein
MNMRLLPYNPQRDVYRLLGIGANASTDEITAACRRLARTFHPDRNGSDRATAEMQVVNAVRRVMTDPESRAIYDRERSRFQAELARPTGPMLDSWPPLHVTRPPRSPASRIARAAAIGLRTTLAELAPTRCQGCRIVIEREDSFCAACGTPLLTGG